MHLDFRSVLKHFSRKERAGGGERWERKEDACDPPSPQQEAGTCRRETQGILKTRPQSNRLKRKLTRRREPAGEGGGSRLSRCLCELWRKAPRSSLLQAGRENFLEGPPRLGNVVVIEAAARVGGGVGLGGDGRSGREDCIDLSPFLSPPPRTFYFAEMGTAVVDF